MRIVIIKVMLFLAIIVGGLIIGNGIKENKKEDSLMGGYFNKEGLLNHGEQSIGDLSFEVSNLTTEEYQRFFRPSQSKELVNTFYYGMFEEKELPSFTKPTDAIYAFFGILRDAAYMKNYTIGCGSIGDSIAPYPVAYQLLTKEKQEKMPYEQFLSSFNGIGHIDMLHMVELPTWVTTNEKGEQSFYMVEVETIQGRANKGDTESAQGFFGYYYGIIGVKKEGMKGYRVNEMYFAPENWLCAPFHGWHYDASNMIQVVFDTQMTITNIKTLSTDGGQIYQYDTTMNEKKYQLFFVRLANGYDILVNQYEVTKEGKKEVNLFGEKWGSFLLTIDNFTKE